MKVEFFEVGRNKRSWVADTSAIHKDDLNEDGAPSSEWLAREAKSRGGLLSNDVDVAGDDLANLEVIVGGFRAVGRCKVELTS